MFGGGRGQPAPAGKFKALRVGEGEGVLGKSGPSTSDITTTAAAAVPVFVN